MEKENAVCRHSGILLSLKNEIVWFAEKNKQTNGDYHMQKNKLTQRDKYHTDFILTHKVTCGYRAWAEKSTNLWNDRNLKQEKMEGGCSQSKDTIDVCGNKPLWNPSLRNVYYYTKKKKPWLKIPIFRRPRASRTIAELLYKRHQRNHLSKKKNNNMRNGCT